MTVIQDLIADLREKRLWPVALLLIVALVAVPVLLSNSSSNNGVPVAQIPPVGSSSAPVPALPAVSVTPTPSNAKLTGHERNPFTQQVKKSSSGSQGRSSTSSTPAETSSNNAKGSSSSSKSSSKSSSPSGSVSSGSTTVPSTTPTPTTTTTPGTAAPPAPTTLTDTQAYHVNLSITNSSGGADAIDGVERLSLIPSPRLPLLIELGVLRGGRRVLFALAPGTMGEGPGLCTPGPVNCQILSLAPNQIEGVATKQANGAVTGALMAVTAIKADDYPSAAAADRARQAESAAGRRLLDLSNVSALSLFPFRPSLGAIVDLSNVTVGGN
jgi:hypothetical protein